MSDYSDMKGWAGRARHLGGRAGANPSGALIGLLVALWLVAREPWLAAGIGAAVFGGPPLWDLAAGWWLAQPWQVRYGVVALSTVVGYVASFARWLAVALVAALIAAAVWAWRRGATKREHRREYIDPLHRAFRNGAALGWAAGTPPERYLAVPVNLLDDPDGITVSAAPGPLLSEDKRRDTERTVKEKCGLRDPRTQWVTRGPHQYLTLKAKERSLPDLVPFDDAFRALLEDMPPHRKLIGFAPGDRPYYIDQKSDAPHTLVVAPTGWGKTTLVGIIAADELHKGGEVAVLDIKFGSMRWLYGLPGVTYARTVEVIHDTFVDKLIPELERRKEVLAATPHDQEPSFPRLFLFIEEMASLKDELQDYWVRRRAELKAEAKEAGVPFDAPPRSPALAAYRYALRMGRQLGVFVMVADQRGEANDIGGSNARFNLGNVILGDPDRATWNIHAKHHPYTPGDEVKGRAFIVRRKAVGQVQVVKASNKELRAWATSGATPKVTLSYTRRKPSTSGNGVGQALGQPRLTVVPVEGPEPTSVTLREAAGDTGRDGGLVPVRLSTLQRYARPDRRAKSGFPQAVGVDDKGAQLFDVEQVLEWSRNRPTDDRRRREEEGA